FTLTFSLVHRPFAVFGMTHALAGPEAAPAGWLGNLHIGASKLPTAGGKEFSNIVDGVVGRPAVGPLLYLFVATADGHGLVFVFVVEVRRLLHRPGPRLGLANFFEQCRRHLFQKAGSYRGFRQV